MEMHHLQDHDEVAENVGVSELPALRGQHHRQDRAARQPPCPRSTRFCRVPRLRRVRRHRRCQTSAALPRRPRRQRAEVRRAAKPPQERALSYVGQEARLGWAVQKLCTVDSFACCMVVNYLLTIVALGLTLRMVSWVPSKKTYFMGPCAPSAQARQGLFIGGI